MLISVFLGLASVMFVGSLFTYLFPEIQVDLLRKNISTLVLYILLPALNFEVVYTAHIGYQFWQLPLLALGSVCILIILAMGCYKWIPLSNTSKGALVLGCAFSNVTYFGIPVLQGLFPNQTKEVIQAAILFEITLTPLGLVAGSILAAFYGKQKKFPLRAAVLALLKMPLLWTTFLALGLNLMQVSIPQFILQATHILAATVPGLMLFSLGMALKYPILCKALRRTHYLLPVLLLKLFISPLIVFLGAKWLNLASPYFSAAILEAAMPSQLISLVIADRFKLDVEILAVAISLTTVAAFISLPIIHLLTDLRY